MKLQYTKEALEDLRSIREFIIENNGSSAIADNVIERIIKNCSLLNVFPNLGTSLSEKIDVETEYRYLISGKSIIFYTIVDDSIFINRILDGRRDYIKILFSKLLK